MAKEGKYIYCIIDTKQDRYFGSIGVGNRGDEVLTIGYDNLGMVVSNYPLAQIDVNHENMLAHEKVIETVMKEFDSVLPVRYGTIASNADEIRNLLDRRYREFKNLLRDMDRKIELSVKGLWGNMDVVFKEIIEENKEIKKAKEEVQNIGEEISVQSKIEIGKLVDEALQQKKEKESQYIIDTLQKTYIDLKLNKTLGDEMFINASFLVDRGREKEFDNIMNDLSEEFKDRIKFKYTGPLPVFNFTNIAIYPETWER
ncbi:MAG: GvpL/GvpF family gas vesicle protein [Ignavibacteriaceae bacterium]|nr:GvpL/GvpF family gas vesicle protein [Ignavibacteriaceae bacterium]